MHVLANSSRSCCNTTAVCTKWNGARSRRVDFIAGEGSLRRHAYCACAACVPRAVGLADYRWVLPRIFIVLRDCCHSNATHAPIANPPNSAQLGGIPYHSPSYIRVVQ